MSDSQARTENSRAHGPRTSVAIGESFRGRRNSLNFLRLVLAAIVLFDHTHALGGFGTVYIFGKSTPSTMAVFGFFGISGYLIAASAERNSVGRYLWQRVLRIAPAFWICLIITAMVFGLIGWFHSNPSCGFSCYVHVPNGPVDYIYRNSWLKVNQQAITGTLRGVPFPVSWNGSLWTLFYEFLCYLALAVLAVTRLLRHRWTVALLALAVWTTEIVTTSVPSLNAQLNNPAHFDLSVMFAFLPVFLAGSLIYLYRDNIPDSGAIALACVGAIVVGFVVPLGPQAKGFTLASSSSLVAPALAYLLLWLGIHLPFQKVGARNDYSYGVYIYAFPVSQLLALWSVHRWGYLAYQSLVVLLTIPFAVGSWWLIERRALRFKKLSFRTTEAEVAPKSEPGGPAEPVPLPTLVGEYEPPG
jgi:peptidoglycan/LPS O-acetylase OafA/YrhL